MATEDFHTPAWVHDAIFYHIFPERFANGDPGNDPPGSMPWGSTPTVDNFMGGDLQGVMDRIDYLVDLGVTAIYFNPIFKARSNHKFDHGDYMRVDPHFGTNDLMKQLVRKAHSNGIRVILDISQNHSGREFFAFEDVVKHGEASRYRDWYHFEGFPVSGPEEPNYECWWGFGSLPEFNNDHPEVREYFWSVTRYWMEEVGIDGWRLDVANEISHEYWREWRKLVKGINAEAYIVGEIWGDGSPWLKGDNFDAVMNYVWRDLVAQYFAERSIGTEQFAHSIDELLNRHPPSVNKAMFNLLGSHDTARFLTVAGGHRERMKLAIFFQMTYVGAPVLYYGDEIGMQGEKDPGCRGAFPWDERAWDMDMRSWVRRLAKLRHATPALRSNEYESVIADDKRTGVYGYRRGSGQQSLIALVNNSEEHQRLTLSVPEWRDVRGGIVDLITNEPVEMEGGELFTKVTPWQALLLGARQ